MARTQKNKATAKHLGSLKAKLAKLKRDLISPPKGAGGGPGEGFWKVPDPDLLYWLPFKVLMSQSQATRELA